MEDFLVALGLLLFIEGALYAVAPDAMKRALVSMLQTPDNALRVGGACAALLGVVLVWFVR